MLQCTHMSVISLSNMFSYTTTGNLSNAEHPVVPNQEYEEKVWQVTCLSGPGH
jgi:hypothetical protein